MIEAIHVPWYTAIWHLFPVWVLIAVIVYVIYGVFRTWYIFRQTMEEGFFRGLYEVYIGGLGKPIYADVNSGARTVIGHEPKYLRLYHIVWVVIDVPCIAVGACMPFIRRVFTFKIAPIKRPSKEEDLD